jgi:hypothetical protein
MMVSISHALRRKELKLSLNSTQATTHPGYDVTRRALKSAQKTSAILRKRERNTSPVPHAVRQAVVEDLGLGPFGRCVPGVEHGEVVYSVGQAGLPSCTRMVHSDSGPCLRAHVVFKKTHLEDSQLLLSFDHTSQVEVFHLYREVSGPASIGALLPSIPLAIRKGVGKRRGVKLQNRRIRTSCALSDS